MGQKFILRRRKNMYENHKIFKTEFAGRPLIVETGKFAQLANGSALVRYGETVVLATATASAKCISRTKNNRISNLISEFNTVFYILNYE